MVLNIILMLVFAGSLGALWYKASLKIPELVAIPDQVITERLHEDSARVHLFLLHIKQWYRDGKFSEMFLNFLAKALYKLHIGILRLDNTLIGSLKKLREGGAMVNGNGASNAEYWKELRLENLAGPIVEEDVPMETISSSATKMPNVSRVEEVRKKK